MTVHPHFKQWTIGIIVSRARICQLLGWKGNNLDKQWAVKVTTGEVSNPPTRPPQLTLSMTHNNCQQLLSGRLRRSVRGKSSLEQFHRQTTTENPKSTDSKTGVAVITATHVVASSKAVQSKFSFCREREEHMPPVLRCDNRK